MASSFDRWEKDPFFSAAEEVQESADRMQSTYRTWVHAKTDTLNEWNMEDLQRDLHTAVGTTKWQLEEFERAVSLTYVKDSTDDAKDRHRDFIVAIEDNVSRVQNSLNDSKEQPPWVRLDEGERDELALFLTGLPHDGMKCSSESPEKPYGHRRTASANANSDSWKIALPNDSTWQQNSVDGHPPIPPRKIPSLSSFLNSMDTSPSKPKWLKNGFRKLKAIDPSEESVRLSQQDRGADSCFERSKSCLDSCDDCYDKQLYGWYGALQRQLQRSHYRMRYSRSAQLTFSALLLFFIVLIAFHVI